LASIIKPPHHFGKESFMLLEFRHKESRGETLVGLAYVGKMGRGGRRSGGWGTFRI
jgi:hypothetical protein